ncbi:MAG: hypothetical protein ABJA16_08595 [Nakamurella sp.]
MTALLLSLGIVAWPTSPPKLFRVPRQSRFRLPVSLLVSRAVVPMAAGGAGGVAIAWLGSPAAGIAAALLSATIGALIRSALLTRARQRDALATTNTVRALAREVHAGADLATAITAVRVAAVPEVSALLRRLLVDTEDTGGPGPPAGETAASPVGFALVAAVRLSRRTGVPLAGLLARLAEGLDDERRAADHRAAAVAGARLSGWVLAGLPLMGVVLGAGMGADPLPVLVSDGLGGVLLVVGTVLLCAGLLWSARIARSSG